ncbi:hypothetical protein HK104_008450 [Borealophlyctis nickersoniae]|nr:hypothetical protein HK104_008450 [Borealophlyctis nickersoniae]
MDVDAAFSSPAPLVLGESFQPSSQQSHVLLRHPFAPDTIDGEKVGTLMNTNGSSWLAEIPNAQGPDPHSVPATQTVSDEVECILFYDEERQTFVLERLTSSFILSQPRGVELPVIQLPEREAEIGEADEDAAFDDDVDNALDELDAEEGAVDDDEALDEGLDDAFDEALDDVLDEALDEEMQRAEEIELFGEEEEEGAETENAAESQRGEEDADGDDEFGIDAVLADMSGDEDVEDRAMGGEDADGLESDEVNGLSSSGLVANYQSSNEDIESPAPNITVNGTPDHETNGLVDDVANGAAHGGMVNGTHRSPKVNGVDAREPRPRRLGSEDGSDSSSGSGSDSGSSSGSDSSSSDEED